MSHLYLVASSDVGPSRESAGATVRAARMRLQLVPDTGSLNRLRPGEIAGPNRQRVLTVLLGLAVIASAGIAIIKRRNADFSVATPEPATTGLALLPQPQEPAELFNPAIDGSGWARPFAKEY